MRTFDLVPIPSDLADDVARAMRAAYEARNPKPVKPAKPVPWLLSALLALVIAGIAGSIPSAPQSQEPWLAPFPLLRPLGVAPSAPRDAFADLLSNLGQQPPPQAERTDIYQQSLQILSGENLTPLN